MNVRSTVRCGCNVNQRRARTGRTGRVETHDTWVLDAKSCYRLGSSQIVHLVVALAGLLNPHIPHVQFDPDAALVGGFKPAAAQSNPPFGAAVVVEVLDDPAAAAIGAGASQMVHFSVALAGLLNMH